MNTRVVLKLFRTHNVKNKMLSSVLFIWERTSVGYLFGTPVYWCLFYKNCSKQGYFLSHKYAPKTNYVNSQVKI